MEFILSEVNCKKEKKIWILNEELAYYIKVLLQKNSNYKTTSLKIF